MFLQDTNKACILQMVISFKSPLVHIFYIQPLFPLNFICWRIQSIWPTEFDRETASVLQIGSWTHKFDWIHIWFLLVDYCILLLGGILCLIALVLMLATIEMWCLDSFFIWGFLEGGILTISHLLANVKRQFWSTIWLPSGKEFI